MKLSRAAARTLGRLELRLLRTGGADVFQTSGIHRDVSSLMRRF